MADLKISQLTSATLPLAGTEVLPIVQSSTTKKVATDNLTVKNIRSNATTGILQMTGPAAAATRTMTVPDANFTAARTDASNSFTSDQTLATGNLIQGTAAKGFNFTANTPAAGMTSQLLNWYEQGTWTPTDASGAGLTFTTSKTIYTRIGNVVTVTGIITWPVTASGAAAQVGGLPFTSKTGSMGFFPGVTGASLNIVGNVADGTATFYLAQPETTNNRTNANLSGQLFAFSGSYIAA